ncbi:MAG TPA: GTPase ObgE [Candidatus Hydrogenedentes bacterium]|nr:GTPase ObgE [Candidatus Hydrogenedentota bacterium]HOJ67225.1 GTPase ObgE [Candidatus Hydrogenedentota bacterium]HOV60204.1 GTPase ObgE [Candidatus Hydrogenedentota bacterium]
MFIDRVKIHAFGGDGGNGCVAFRREAFVPRGGPSGGDGGDGGHVVLRATARLTTLLDLSWHPHIRAGRGGHGEGSQRHGKRGADRVVEVPLGTMVRCLETDELLADLVREGQTFVAARGGRGGRGNARFATPVNRAPRFAEKGEPGEYRELLLELKLIAEAGLVGKPNAGKSTLLAASSAARPRIADYPFTTLKPNLGVARLSGHREFTLADIPGIIEGASEGKGLGLDFLRHIERTRLLLFVIDLGDPDPLETLAALEHELLAYGAGLEYRPRLVVFNKADVPENREKFSQLAAVTGPDTFLISAATGEGVPHLLERAWQLVEQARAKEREDAATPDGDEPAFREYTYEAPFEICRISGGFRVRGRRPERVVSMTDFDNPEAVAHLQQVLRKMGLFKALARLGAREGDTVEIGDISLEYLPDTE